VSSRLIGLITLAEQFIKADIGIDERSLERSLPIAYASRAYGARDCRSLGVFGLPCCYWIAISALVPRFAVLAVFGHSRLIAITGYAYGVPQLYRFFLYSP